MRTRLKRSEQDCEVKLTSGTGSVLTINYELFALLLIALQYHLLTLLFNLVHNYLFQSCSHTFLFTNPNSQLFVKMYLL